MATSVANRDSRRRDYITPTGRAQDQQIQVPGTFGRSSLPRRPGCGRLGSEPSGWVESLHSVYAWRPLRGRRGWVRRPWHRRQKRAFRFSGHIRNCERLLALIEEQAGDEPQP